MPFVVAIELAGFPRLREFIEAHFEVFAGKIFLTDTASIVIIRREDVAAVA